MNVVEDLASRMSPPSVHVSGRFFVMGKYHVISTLGFNVEVCIVLLQIQLSGLVFVKRELCTYTP